MKKKTKKPKLKLSTEKVRLLQTKDMNDAAGGMGCSILGSVPHCGHDCNSSG